MLPLIILAGPTTSRKSDTAIALAEKLDLEVVNADSMQVYKYFDIGTAKPSRECVLKVPHHLIDVLEPDDGLIGIGSGGNYALAAARALMDRDELDAEAIAQKAMAIAADICIYTNNSVTIESI